MNESKLLLLFFPFPLLLFFFSDYTGNSSLEKFYLTTVSVNLSSR